MKEYKETHQQGLLSIERNKKLGISEIKVIECDFGVQIASDGRIWLCIDGKAFVRFNPNILKYRKGE